MQLLNGDTDFTAHACGFSGAGRCQWASALPAGLVAHIWKPAKSAMTSGRARTKAWRLRIERQGAPWIDPLMGWTSGDDTAHQVDLAFPSLEAAIRHAERMGIAFQLHLPPGMAASSRSVLPSVQPEPEGQTAVGMALAA